MIASWWDAHAIEFIVWIVVFVLCGMIWTIAALSDAASERRKKKRDGLQ